SIHIFMQDAMPVTIQNCSGPAIMLTPSVDPPFFIEGNFPTTLAAAQPQTFAVGFHPTKVGPVMKTLRITTSDQQVLMVMLRGEGVTEGPPDDGGSGSNGYHQTSFYACTCTSGSPSGGLPIVLAIGLVIFRRRSGSSSPR